MRLGKLWRRDRACQNQRSLHEVLLFLAPTRRELRNCLKRMNGFPASNDIPRTKSTSAFSWKGMRDVNRASARLSGNGIASATASMCFFPWSLTLVRTRNVIGCAASVHMKFPCNTGEEGGNEPLGHPTDLERKRKGESSMLETRRTLEGM